MGIIIAPYHTILHRQFTPINTGLRRRLLCRTRSASRGSGSLLMKAFASKADRQRFQACPSLPMLTAPYPQGRLPAAGAKGMVNLEPLHVDYILCLPRPSAA
jgi:hypothetical protein